MIMLQQNPLDGSTTLPCTRRTPCYHWPIMAILT